MVYGSHRRARRCNPVPEISIPLTRKRGVVVHHGDNPTREVDGSWFVVVVVVVVRIVVMVVVVVVGVRN